ncbi:MFS transporter [Patescibacteria group bacterium]|nr:MAG: MFS transporter [Patescibacteria group bacterium]
MNKKNIVSWLVYDLGNSFFVTAISGLFLAQWLILDNKLDDIWYGAGFSIATIFVLMSSPFLGAWSDKLGKRMPFLKWASIALFVFNGLIAITAVSNLPMISRAFIVLGLSIIVQYLYQMSLIFYNSLLKDISTEKNRGKISGLGEGFNSLGWLLGSVALLPFANGAITLIGEPGRHQVFIPAFIISTLLMLPMLLLFKEQSLATEEQGDKTISKKTVEGIKQLFHENRNVGVFLVGFSFISDLMLTIELFFAVVMDALYKVDDNTKTLVFAVNLVATILLGYLFGKLGDRYGHKPILVISCAIFIVTMVVFFASSSLSILYLVGILSGAGVGGYYVVSRSLMIKLSPQDRLGEYFGFYSTFARIASITGPLVWGGITLLLRDYTVLKYQVAGMVMIGLLTIGTLILFKVKENTLLASD